MSSAPASSARSKIVPHLRSHRRRPPAGQTANSPHRAQPLSPDFVKIFLMSAPVRLRLSVSTSIIKATPHGVTLVGDRIYDCPPASPVPLFNRRSIASFVICDPWPSLLLSEELGSYLGRHPQRELQLQFDGQLCNSFPRALSAVTFLCLMVAHLECPDIY